MRIRLCTRPYLKRRMPALIYLPCVTGQLNLSSMSFNPDPADTLKFIIDKKRSNASLACEIVSEASEWLKRELAGADIKYTFLSCDCELHYGYSMFLISRTSSTRQMSLSIKIAEVNEKPLAFCEIKVSDNSGYSAFPLDTALDNEEGRHLLLAYVADFVLSCEAIAAEEEGDEE